MTFLFGKVQFTAIIRMLKVVGIPYARIVHIRISDEYEVRCITSYQQLLS